MSTMPELSIYSHQEVIVLSDGLLEKLQLAGNAAMPLVLEVALGSHSALSELHEMEVSLIDDSTIAEVHLQFMDIPGATDVITFDHGEIHISVETTRQQAIEFGNDFESELMLYIIHGLLHLAGYEDATESDRLRMDRLQQNILSKVWR
jgi:probable rRNA maturation factor